jgi:hypothetical protein
MQKTLALLIPALLLSGLASNAQAGLYRWVDEDGSVHYSDSVPPTQIEKGHTELSEEGIRINSIPPVKTPEELRREKELERLRAQHERLVQKQRSADLVLLRTFRSEDDIKIARDEKLAAVDVMIKVTKNNVRRQQEWLSRLRSEAADLERAGKPVPQRLSNNIARAERTIGAAYSNILDREAQKDSIRTRFGQDLVRFRQLKDLPKKETPVKAQDPRPILHNIVTCEGPEECSRLWEKSTNYVRLHANTAVQASGDNILITAPPTDEQDISLVLSRIDDKEGPGASLFLDLQCERSLRGEKRCESQQAQEIVRGFRAAIMGEDGAQP